MKKIVLSLMLAFSVFVLAAQHRFTGYLYTYPTGIKDRFEYTVSTTRIEGAYETIYSLYRPGSKKCRYTIIALHLKDSKKVVVSINDEQYILTVMTGKDETTYDQPSLKPFGFRGNLGILDKSAPNQLVVQFLSQRYEYVRVLRFLGSFSDDIYQFFMFNGSDKIEEPKNPSPAVQNGGRSKSKAIFHGATSATDSTGHK